MNVVGACPKTFTKRFIGIALQPSTGIRPHSAIWRPCIFLAGDSVGMISKRHNGFGRLQCKVFLQLKTTLPLCITQVEGFLETTRKRQSGHDERQNKDTLSRKRTSVTFTNRGRVYRLTTSPLTRGTALERQEEMAAALRE